MREIGRGKKQLASIKWPAVSLQSTPTSLANWILQEKAESLLALFRKVAQEIPAAQAFLNSLAEVGSEIEQATAIRTWLQANGALLNTITEMRLTASSLTILPDEIVLFTGLKELHLQNNQLQTLPASFGGLTQLQELDLDNNQLQTLPISLGKLTQLEVLFLNDNQLQTLPASLGNLSQLHMLFLNNNQLSTLPSSLGNLSQLKDLWLYNNQLQTLPASLGNLSQLETLYLNKNPIQFVPKELKRSSIAAIRDTRVIHGAQELPETQPSCRTPEETKLQPSLWQQLTDAFYSCFSAIASFACWIWTRLMAALSEAR